MKDDSVQGEDEGRGYGPQKLVLTGGGGVRPMEGSFAIRIGRGRRNRFRGKSGGPYFDFSPGLWLS